MMLLIDAGNTRVKFGWLDRARQAREPAALALQHAELPQLASWLATLPAPPVGAIGVSVASTAVSETIEQIVRETAQVPLRWVTSTAEAGGVVNLYDDPARLGADRWLALIGLAARTPGAAILASFGTATTVDTLGPITTTPAQGCAPGRRFEGGIILPGPELMRRSLSNGTAGLPYAQGRSTPMPRNTDDAISSGVAVAQAGAVLSQWRNAIELMAEAPTLYCTGGGWSLVEDEVKRSLARAQADLRLPAIAPEWLETPVLDGLAVLASR
ncbi:MAG TPA: type III pantothenate kinase [Burkholderiaceae bacterium]|nr:type III pantothenate kinase [Burkholderiaceae bacterium]